MTGGIKMGLYCWLIVGLVLADREEKAKRSWAPAGEESGKERMVQSGKSKKGEGVVVLR